MTDILKRSDTWLKNYQRIANQPEEPTDDEKERLRSRLERQRRVSHALAEKLVDSERVVQGLHQERSKLDAYLVENFTLEPGSSIDNAIGLLGEMKFLLAYLNTNAYIDGVGTDILNRIDGVISKKE